MQQNYFELFGLPQTFELDVKQLETNYRNIQSTSHPDRFVTAGATEKLQAMQTATLANEAYAALKSPANRAKYLLALQGIDAISETNTAMPAAFLMQQLEWREEVADAAAQKDIIGISKVLSNVKAEAANLENQLKTHFKNQDLVAATQDTRQLIFMQKVITDVQQTLEKIEDLV